MSSLIYTQLPNSLAQWHFKNNGNIHDFGSRNEEKTNQIVPKKTVFWKIFLEQSIIQLLKTHIVPSVRRQGSNNPLPIFYAPEINTSLSCFFGQWQALLHIYRQRLLRNLKLFFCVALMFSYLSILQITDYHFICHYWQSLICISKALSFARSIDFYVSRFSI